MSKSRPPIVSVLGHVDHGKTSLLDALRETRVATREAGGITQSIGASVVTDKSGKDITFIDTPGHAAFNEMRSRGANIADIVILVVAADDGVKPQTLEALKFIRDAKTPLLVAITKIDLPTANIESVLGQLEKEEVLFEGRGGETPYVQVSAKNKKGLDDLLEMIILMAEVQEVSADPDGSLEALVIETNKDNRGPLVSLVVRNGTLSVGEKVYSGGVETKIRGLFDTNSKSVKSTLPGYPALVLGFSELPKVGSIVRADPGKDVSKETEAKPVNEDAELKVIIKTGSAGSLEAVLGGTPDFVAVIRSEVGELTESDVFFAKDAGCTIFVFDAKVSTQVKRLAENEGVPLYEFKIIYELLDKMEEIVKSGREKVLGEAQILEVFPFNDQKVAGSKVKSGKIYRTKEMVVKRNDKELGRVKVRSLKKQKEDVEFVSQGEEFGVIFTPQLDFQVGDMLLSVEN